MQQMYPCSKCGAPVAYGAKFCSLCGNNINWGAQQAPPPAPPPPPYGYPPPNQQQPWGQQQPPANQPPGWGQPPPYNQPPGWVNPNQPQQQNMYGPQGAMPRKSSSSRAIPLLVALILIVFTIGGIAIATNGAFFKSSSNPTPTTPTTPVTPTPAAPTPATPAPATPAPQKPQLPASQATRVTAAEVIAAYAADVPTAIATYQEKFWAITGTISMITGGPPPVIYVNGGTAGPIELQFSFSQGADVWIVDKGQSVTIEGRIYNYVGGIIVADQPRLVQ